MRRAAVLAVAVGTFVLSGCGADPRSSEGSPGEGAAPSTRASAIVAAAGQFRIQAPPTRPHRGRGRARPAVMPQVNHLVRNGGALVPSGAIGAAAVVLPLRADAAVELSNPAAQVSIGIARLGAGHASAELVDGLAVYPAERADDPDAIVRVADEGVEDFLLYRTRPAREEVRYEVALDGVRGLRAVDGVVEFLDAGGAPRLRARAPAVIGADGARRAADLAVRGCAVDTNPAPPWGRPPVRPGAERCTLVVAWRDVSYPALVDPDWVATGSMSNNRVGHTATLLDDGRVLVVGGCYGVPASELFDPATSTWAVAAPMPLAPDRSYHTATKLGDGTVLVAAGATDTNIVSSAALYDAASGAWSATASLAVAREAHTATLLGDGSVMLCGGWNSGGLTSCERYQAGAFGSGGAILVGREDHTATLLTSGKIFVAGGDNELESSLVDAEVFDPAIGSSLLAHAMTKSRTGHTASLLPDGSVLVVGGVPGGMGFPAYADPERFDPVAKVWTMTAAMTQQRVWHTASTLSNGRVMVAGGCTGLDQNYDCAQDVSSVELFDPVANAWLAMPSLLTPRDSHTATNLLGGGVLVAGGSKDLTWLYSSERFALASTGAACPLPGVCESGFCADGVCCEVACAGPCEACSAASKGAGVDGVCAPVPAGADPRGMCQDSGNACGDDGVCDGSGACAKYPVDQGCTLSPCTSDADCASGHCADGICCDKACDGPCVTCVKAKGAVADGTCGAVPAGTDPDDDCPDSGSNDCDAIEVCGLDSTCQIASAVCAPYTCSGTSGCLASCTSDSDCAAGNRCDAGACVKVTATCDDHIAVTPDGQQIDCSPYKCDATGSCRATCASIDDCAAPSVCDTSGKCVLRNEATAGNDSGCGCRVAREDREQPSSPLALFALGALSLRRRASRRSRRLEPS